MSRNELLDIQLWAPLLKPVFDSRFGFGVNVVERIVFDVGEG